MGEAELHEAGCDNVLLTERGSTFGYGNLVVDFRGFDTLGEVTVVFTAGIAVMLLIGGRRKKSTPEQQKGEQDDA